MNHLAGINRSISAPLRMPGMLCGPWQAAGLIIQQAEPSQAPIIHDITKLAYLALRPLLVPPSGTTQESLASVRHQLEAGEIVIAWMHGAPAGCIRFNISGGTLYFGRLAVLPRYQNRGLAGSLIAFIEALAKKLGLPVVMLEVRLVLQHNIEMYKRRGYRIREHRWYPGRLQGWLVMRKDLKAAAIAGHISQLDPRIHKS